MALHPTALRRGSFLASNALDAFGSQMYHVAVDLFLVATIAVSATTLGALNATAVCSVLVVPLVAGWIVDTSRPIVVLVFSLIFKVGLMILAVALVAAQTHAVVPFFLLALAFGVVDQFSSTAQVAVTRQVGEGNRAMMARLIARLTAADRVAAIAGPALAAALVARSGDAACVVVATALLGFAVVALVPELTGTPARGDQDLGSQKPTPSLREYLAGFSTLWADKFLCGSTITIAAGNLGLALSGSIMPIVILRELVVSKPTYGVLLSTGAGVGLCAALVAPRVLEKISARTCFRWGSPLQAVAASLPLLALWVPHTAAVVLLACFEMAWALIMTMTNISGAAYLAATVPESLLGRTSAARRMVAFAVVPVGALLGGLLADAAGVWLPLTLWPAVTAVAAGLFLMLSARPLAVKG